MSGSVRIGATLVAACALAVAYGWCAFTLREAERRPETRIDVTGSALGPSGAAFGRAAETHMADAVRSLNDRSTGPSERITAATAALSRAERALVAGLRVRPGDASALARLAAVRWELDPPRTVEEMDRSLGLVRLASRMAPRDPAIQRRLAELLLRAGRRDEALAYARRTVELDPGRTVAIVGLLAEQAFDGPRIHDALPHGPELLVALYRRFYRGPGGAAPFLALVERTRPGLAGVEAELLPAVAAALLDRREPARLLDLLETIDGDGEGGAETITSYRTRALLGLERHDEALRVAESAFEARPGSLVLALVLGDTALAAERHERAIEAYRAGLAIVARGTGSASSRARLYRSIGRAEESAGRRQRARDAYRLAIEVGDDDWSRRRLDALRPGRTR